jgi:hypothetical protein
VSVVVVVVELVVTGGATTTGAGTTATGAGAGTSTIGAGAVSSTVLWYEHPVAIPATAMAAGIIAIFLINRILVTSIGYILGEQQEAGQKFCALCLELSRVRRRVFQ